MLAWQSVRDHQVPLSSGRPTSYRRRSVAGRVLAVSTALAIASASASGPGDDVQETLTLTEKVRLVLLPTTVTTRSGKPVRGLEFEDFRLYQDGAVQRIDLFSTEQDSAISLAFLLDVSGSMGLGGRLDEAKRGIRVFVESLGSDDRMGLICFADSQVEWVTDFTRDRAAFLQRLTVQHADGRTALYDALAASPRLVDEQITGRKAIVLITDGLENASEMGRLRATWLARRVAIPIYTLSFIPMRESLHPRRVREALRVLGRFSEETGGTLFTIHQSADLTRAVGRIQEELRHQYVIGFYPEGPAGDGSFRPLRLETVRERLEVRTRRGYYPEP